MGLGGFVPVLDYRSQMKVIGGKWYQLERVEEHDNRKSYISSVFLAIIASSLTKTCGWKCWRSSLSEVLMLVVIVVSVISKASGSGSFEYDFEGLAHLVSRASLPCHRLEAVAKFCISRNAVTTKCPTFSRSCMYRDMPKALRCFSLVMAAVD